MTPGKALSLLKEGNRRFLEKEYNERDNHWRIKQTIDSQHPFAFILTCIDSRVDPSIIFDQGLGDLFISRIAGNFVDEHMLGSMEYACAVVGSKLILVLGHTSCGAVMAACDHINLGHLTASLKIIKRAVDKTPVAEGEDRSSKNLDFVNKVAEQNVMLAIEDIKQRSKILRRLYKVGDIDIRGAIYNHATGEVNFCHGS